MYVDNILHTAYPTQTQAGLQGISNSLNFENADGNGFVGIMRGYSENRTLVGNYNTPCSIKLKNPAPPTADNIFDFYYGDITTPGQTPTIQVACYISSSGSLMPPSDARLKTNITPLAGDTLGIIKKMTFCTYKLAENPRQQVGVIAQQVAEDFPHLVDRPPHAENGQKCGNADCFCNTAEQTNRYYSFDYSKFSVYVAHALQQFIEREHTPLKEENERLKLKLASLEKRLEIIESKL